MEKEKIKTKKIKGYKAFNRGLKCKDFQYEVGKEYKTDKIKLCETGFHFCENPLDVLDFYDLCDSEFAEIEAWGEIETDDKKSVTDNIKINAKLDLPLFIKASFDFLWEKCKNKEKDSGNSSQLASSGNSSKLASSGNSSKLASSGNSSKLASSGNSSQLASSGNSSKLASSGNSSKLASSGNYSQLASSGNSSQLASSGYSSKLASSGNYSQLASSGNSSKLASSGNSSKLASSGNSSQLASSGYSSQLASSGNSSQLASSGYSSKLASSGNSSQLASSGYSSKLASSGKHSIIAGIGIENKAKGIKGNWIVLAEWVYDSKLSIYIPKNVKSVKIDGKKIKEDTYYELKNGKFKQCKD